MNYRQIVALLFFIFIHSLSLAQWSGQILDSYPVKNQALYRLVKFTHRDTQQTVYVNSVLLYAGHYKAQIVDQPSFAHFLFFPRVYTLTKVHRAFLGINGGFFSPEQKPLGLLIINQKSLSSYSSAKLLSGIVLINQTGQISVHHRQVNYQHTRDALQAGPFLIRAQGPHSLKSNGDVKRRTIIAQSGENILVFSTTPARLQDLANIVKTQSESFGVSNINLALNLDGGSSTAMTILFPDRQKIVIPEILPVRNVILFKLQ